jgi:hypothetical protein
MVIAGSLDQLLAPDGAELEDECEVDGCEESDDEDCEPADPGPEPPGPFTDPDDEQPAITSAPAAASIAHRPRRTVACRILAAPVRVFPMVVRLARLSHRGCPAHGGSRRAHAP